MKAKTYARLALLIPLLLWVILLLVELLITAVVPADLMSDGPNTFFGLLTILLFSYVLGILFWLIPYLILSITLLLLSFKSRLETFKMSNRPLPLCHGNPGHGGGDDHIAGRRRDGYAIDGPDGQFQRRCRDQSICWRHNGGLGISMRRPGIFRL